MDHLITIPLNTDSLQRDRLSDLRTQFAEACNAVAKIATDHQCWNRVALHHMVYREMRERFPDLGSQMVCNAVYSVCRACRLVFQNPLSPLHTLLATHEKLPTIRFTPSAPVYFDRHTLSLRNGVLSLYTLEGRMKFRVTLSEAQEKIFQSEKLKEVSLTELRGQFLLQFKLGEADGPGPEKAPSASPDLPEYLLIQDEPLPSTSVALITALPDNITEGSAQ